MSGATPTRAPVQQPRFHSLEEIIAEAARIIRAPVNISFEELATGKRPPDPPKEYEPPHTWEGCLDSAIQRERWASMMADLEEIDFLFHCIPDGWEPAFCDALEDRLGLHSEIYVPYVRRKVTPDEMDAIGARAAHMMISWVCWGGDPDARQPWRTICEARAGIYTLHKLEAGAVEAGVTGRLLKAGNGVTKAFWGAACQTGEAQQISEAVADMSQIIKRGLTFLKPGAYDDLRPAFDFIPGTLQDNSVAIIYGAPGSGKTFYAIHLLCCAAQGREVFGERAEPRVGLYMGLEGEAGVKARLKAWCAHNGVASSPVHYALGSFDIIEPEQRAVLIDYLRQHKIQFVVIDTLSKAMTGADENTAAEMSPIIDALHEIKSYTQACVVAITHTGKDQRAGIRGWSGQLGNADTAIEIDAQLQPGETATLGTLRTANIRKQRDGEAGQRRGFRLQRYDTDQMDERGKPVASVALCEGDFTDAEISDKLAKPKPMSKSNREALAVLEAMTADARLLGAPDVDSLRKRLKAEGWGPDNTASWRSAFNRFVAKLEEDSNGQLSYH